MKVLVVEDSRFFAAALRKGLDTLNLEHDLAISRAEARTLLAAAPKRYLAALVDLHLPDCAEGEVVDDTLAAGVPTIVFTSTFEDDLREMVLTKPIIDYVPKNTPTCVEQVMKAVRRMITNPGTAVLVVDDSRTSRQIMTHHLQVHRFTVIEASSGEQALRILDSRDDIRVAVVDFNMSGMDGCALTTAIRRRFSSDRMVVIGLSAYGNNLLSARFMKAGASDFITKPFIPEELFCRLYQNLDHIDHIDRLQREAAERRTMAQDMAALSTLQNTLIATSPLGIGVYRADGPCLLANPALAAMVGGTVEQLQAQNFRTLEGWKTSGLLRMADQALAEGRQLRGSFDLTTPFGRHFSADADVAAFDLAGKPHLFIGVRDSSDLRAAEEKLRKEREKLLAVLNSAASAIVTIDRRGVIQSVNPAAERIFGWSVMEMAGNDVSMLIPPALRDRHGDRLALFRPEQGRNVAGIRREVQGLRKDGSVFPMELAASALHDDDGELTFIALITDQSARHAADSMVRRLSSAVEHSSAIVLITDAQGRIEYANPRLCAVSGYTREELVGKTPALFQSGEKTVEDYNQMWSHLRAGQVWHGEFRNRRKDGSEYWVKSSIDPIRDDSGRLTHYVAVQEDVTELKDAKEAAERANQAKSEFLSAMSHELRTPLNAIIGFSQLLLSSRKSELENKQRERVDMILSAGNHLLELINEILDLSRIEAGRMDLVLETVPLAATTAQCVAQLEEMAHRHHVGVENRVTDSDLSAWCDARRLRQILLNLLSNAIKYNRDGGTVTVTAWGDDGQIGVAVADTGPGIAPDRQGELFQPFNRLGAENTQIQGTGIGLVVTKSLVEAMGGDIDFASVVDKGTTFRVSLPRAAAPRPAALQTAATRTRSRSKPRTAVPPAAPPQDGGQPGGRDFHILYVEDNPTNVTLMEHVVAHFDNTRLSVSATAESALIQVRHTPPDLILMDINLPGASGIDATRALKGDGKTAAIPVAILSANVLPETKRQAKTAGADYFLAKPLVLAELEHIVRHIVESRHG